MQVGARAAPVLAWADAGEHLGASAAGHAHMACDRRLPGAPVDDEVMAFGLARDGLIDGAPKQGLIGARAQGRAQIRRVILAEAHIERPRAG